MTTIIYYLLKLFRDKCSISAIFALESKLADYMNPPTHNQRARKLSHYYSPVEQC